MYGILLMLSGTLFAEFANSLGKEEVRKKEETIYSMGFLNTFFVSVLFISLTIIKPELFVFSLASLPTFAIRVILEFAQAHFVFKAIAKAERTTFSFLRILTLPLLLIVDLILGYNIFLPQFIGIGLIVAVLAVLLINHGISHKGSGLVLFTAFNAVITISLYKYNITHFNSVVAEQTIAILFIFAYFVIMTIIKNHQNPFKLLRKKLCFTQSAISGTAVMLESFSYYFAPASVITAAKRSSVVLWSMLSGSMYFREKHIFKKFLGFLVIVIAIFLLTMGK